MSEPRANGKAPPIQGEQSGERVLALRKRIVQTLDGTAR